MDGVDPDTLLEWLQTGVPDARDLQLMALEQLCMLLLMSDNIDRCFESCPPRLFLPALCKIFTDETAPENVLEVTARAMTYYLDVSNECTRRITQVDGAVRAICQRLAAAEMSDRTSKDLAEQCVKVLELMCARESAPIYEASGLPCMLTFVRTNAAYVHRDTLHSAMTVITRLCSRVESNSDQLPDVAKELAELLDSDDIKIMECALKCFATLADKIARKSLDASTLNESANLVERMLKKLGRGANRDDSKQLPVISQKDGDPELSAPVADGLTQSSASMMLGILIALCKSTASAGEQLVSNPDNTMPALAAVLKNTEEKCCLDALRLADILICLVCEGRDSLTRGGAILSSSSAHKLPNVDASARATEMERVQRALVDAIRQKDSDAFIEAVESHQIDVDHTDDVGQTLLNWASAFGTAEMVQYLCERGADVNRGARSSSLHYAACFGNTEIARILLNHGADPRLRDEHGLTAFEKAKERQDDSHKEVTALLENPNAANQPSPKSTEGANEKGCEANDAKPSSAEAPTANQPISTFIRNNALVDQYLSALMPILCQLYQTTTSISLKRATLALIRCSTQHISQQALEQISSQYNEEAAIDVLLMSVIIEVLINRDTENSFTALMIVKNLLEKDPDIWIEHLVRFGALSHLETIVNEAKDRESAAEPPLTPTTIAANVTTPMTASATIEQIQESVDEQNDKEPLYLADKVLYQWSDWQLVRTVDSLILWCDACAIEFNYASNGWLWYILDGRLLRLCSNGGIETSSQNNVASLLTMSKSPYSKQSFTNKLVNSKQKCTNFSSPTRILTTVNDTAAIGNWLFKINANGELAITNIHPAHIAGNSRQKIVVNEDSPGFQFTSAHGSTSHLTAEATLPLPAFATGWASKKGRRQRLAKEAQQNKIDRVVLQLWNDHLSVARGTARPQFDALQECANRLIDLSDNSPNIDDVVIRATLIKLHTLICDDKALSTYEIASSRLIEALLKFTPLLQENDTLLRIFTSVFNQSLPSLVTKLVNVAESVENLPQYLYDAPGGSPFGMQLLSRRLRLKLAMNENTQKPSDDKDEAWPTNNRLLNRSGRQMRAEPLATVAQLKQYLLRMLAKQWFHYDRSTHFYLQKLKHAQPPVILRYAHDFDNNGLIYYIGTNGLTSVDWTNPSQINCVHVTASDGDSLPYGRTHDILSRDATPINCHSSDDKNAWFTIDLGVALMPTAYTLRHARGYGHSALRTWQLLGSTDCVAWTPLKDHRDDNALNEPGSTHTWTITTESDDSYRYLRIQQMDKNSSNQSYYLSLSGFEIYGKVMGVYIEEFGKTPGPEMKAKKKMSPPPPPASTSVTLPSMFSSQTAEIHANIAKSTKATIERSKCYTSNAMKLMKERRNAKRLASTPTTVTSSVPMTPPVSETSTAASGSSSNTYMTFNIGDRVRMTATVAKQQQDTTPARATRSKAQGVPYGTIGTIESKPRHGVVEVSWDNGQRATHPYLDGNSEIAIVTGEMAPRDTKSSTPPNKEVKSRRSTKGSLSNKMKKINSTSSSKQDSTDDGGSSLADTSLMSTDGASSSTLHATSSNINKKALSTTNLFDEPTSSAVSVASTNAAASAESLQHQTASLENLLARSRIYENMREQHSAIPESPSTHDESMSSLPHSSAHTLDSVPEERAVVTTNTNQPTTFANLVLDDAAEIKIDTADDITETAPQVSTPKAPEELNAETSQPKPTESQIIEQFKPTSQDEIFNARNAYLAKFPNQCGEKAAGVLVYESGRNMVKLHIGSTGGDDSRTTTEPVVLSGESAAILMEYMSDLSRTHRDDEKSNSDDRHRLIMLRLQRLLQLSSGSGVATNSQEVRSLADELVSASAKTAVPVEKAKTTMSKDEETIDLVSALKEHDALAEAESAQQAAVTAIEANADVAVRGTLDFDLSEMSHDEDEDDDEESVYDEDVDNTEEDDELNDDNDHDDEHDDDEDILSNTTLESIDPPPTNDSNKPKDSPIVVHTPTVVVKPKTIAESAPPPITRTPTTFDCKANTCGSTPCAHIFGNRQPTGGIAPDGSLIQPGSRQQSADPNSSVLMRPWDDEYVLKRSFSALIPAFDPRPGRVNVNQTQDVQLPEANINANNAMSNDLPMSDDPNQYRQPKLCLYLEYARHVSSDGEKPQKYRIRLGDDSHCLFYYIQKLQTYARPPIKQSDIARKIWDAQYTLAYELDDDNNMQPQDDNISDVVTTVPSSYNESNCDALSTSRSPDPTLQCELRNVLDVLANLHDVVEQSATVMITNGDVPQYPADMFVSTKVTQKLRLQLYDPLVVSTSALPKWCAELMRNYAWLFSLQTRKLYFEATAFGPSRAIVWLQNQRQLKDQANRNSRSTVGRGMDAQLMFEHNIGRIKHERVRVSRDEDMLITEAGALLNFHAERKAVLEIAYNDEEGTGLGPTLEYYAILAGELQRKDLAMWLCDDDDEVERQLENQPIDLGEGCKPAGFYVRRHAGLFPAPYPPDCEQLKVVRERFHMLGILLGKALQDGRLIDLPLSRPFLKILCSKKFAICPLRRESDIAQSSHQYQSMNVDDDDVDMQDVLTVHDLQEVHPMKARFLTQLTELASRKRQIEALEENEAKRRRVDEHLTLNINGHECHLEDLAMTFTLNPSSRIYQWQSHHLEENKDVTIDNIDEYVSSVLDFYTNSGIRTQMAALRRGFNRVFPIGALQAFSADELLTILSGEQAINWTKDDLQAYTEPKLGFTRDSACIEHLYDVLVEMDNEQRKAFLQFTTGCATLPPGGMANLHPRLTIVKKVDSGDGSYPSVNTCVHYLKLPDYSTKEILKQRLLDATVEKGFHLA